MCCIPERYLCRRRLLLLPEKTGPILAELSWVCSLAHLFWRQNLTDGLEQRRQLFGNPFARGLKGTTPAHAQHFQPRSFVPHRQVALLTFEAQTGMLRLEIGV